MKSHLYLLLLPRTGRSISSLYLCIPLPTYSKTLRDYSGDHIFSQITRSLLEQVNRDQYILHLQWASRYSFLYHFQKSSEIWCTYSGPHHLNKLLITLRKQGDILKAFLSTDSPPSGSQWCFFSAGSGTHGRTFQGLLLSHSHLPLLLFPQTSSITENFLKRSN